MSKLLHIRKLNRLKKFDYSSSGYYFITICTKHKEELLGEVVNRKMVLNDVGEIVNKCWEEIPKHFNNVILDEYVMMPNHVHGILIINNKQITNVGDADLRPLQIQKINHRIRTKMSLSKIIHGFKSSVTRQINKINNHFQW